MRKPLSASAMRRAFAIIVFVLVLGLQVISTPQRGSTSYVDGFEETARYSEQEASQWCWAASIQAVLAYYGIERTQRAIVMATYGRVVNLPASSPQSLYNTLNNFNLAPDSTVEIVRSQWATGSQLTARLLDQELTDDHPVIAWFMNGPSSGHSVVIHSADFTRSGRPETIKYFDPWPGRGFQTVDAQPFGSQIVAFFVIRAVKIDGRESQSRRRSQSDSVTTQSETMEECLDRKVQRCIATCQSSLGHPYQVCVNVMCTRNETNLSVWRPACRREIRRP